MKCTICAGEGHYQDMHNWSDGWGMVTFRCELCDGTGELGDTNLAVLAWAYKRRAILAEQELAALKAHAALYVALVEDGRLPEPALVAAPNPSPFRETWLGYLRAATADLPRVV